jgi:hypothetical protein
MTRKEGEKNIPVKETIRERERNGYNRIAPKRLKGAVAVTVKALFPSRARLDDTELLPFFFRLKFCRVTAGNDGREKGNTTQRSKTKIKEPNPNQMKRGRTFLRAGRDR